MSNFKYQRFEDDIIKFYKSGKTYVDIAKAYNSVDIQNDAQNIRRLIIHKLGHVKGNSKIVITQDIKKKVDKLLHLNKRPFEISKILNIAYPTVLSYLERQKGLSFTIDKGNTNYFDIVDSYAKAYILGFIAADGAIVNNSLTITIKYEDRAILYFIKSEIGNRHKLQEIRRKSSFDPNKSIHHIRYTFADTHLIQSLEKYGITKRKSLTIENIILNIPNQYRDAFIIGYFDGDGSVCIQSPKLNDGGYICKDNSLYISFRGTKEFLFGICDHLNINRSHVHQYDSIPSLTFASKKDTYRLFQCYNNLPFYYIRKHDKFLKRINLPSYDKYKQG